MKLNVQVETSLLGASFTVNVNKEWTMNDLYHEVQKIIKRKGDKSARIDFLLQHMAISTVRYCNDQIRKDQSRVLQTDMNENATRYLLDHGIKRKSVNNFLHVFTQLKSGRLYFVKEGEREVSEGQSFWDGLEDAIARLSAKGYRPRTVDVFYSEANIDHTWWRALGRYRVKPKINYNLEEYTPDMYAEYIGYYNEDIDQNENVIEIME